MYIVPVCDHRRGSNVSLTLDMCTPGCTEPYGYGAQLSPRDQSAQEYLRQGTHVLTPAMLHTRAMDDQSLQAEFYVSAAAAAAPAHTHTHTSQALAFLLSCTGNSHELCRPEGVQLPRPGEKEPLQNHLT